MIRLPFTLCVALLLAAPVNAQNTNFSRPLITDVSMRKVEIHAAFSGTSLLFYGARNAPGDIVITIRGPAMEGVLRRKDQIGGVWMVVEQGAYSRIPSFYRLASTQPLSNILTPENKQSLVLGAAGLEQAISAANPEAPASLHGPLIGQLRKRGWVSTKRQNVQYFGDALFKASIDIPDNIPRGGYLAEVFLIHEGRVTSSQTIPITAEKTGMDAWVAKQSKQQPWAYGFAAVMLALFGGWLGNRMLGR